MRMFFCITGRRKSMTRLVKRTFSEMFSSSIWNGGVAASFIISISLPKISMPPDTILSFLVPSGRLRTRPVMLNTYSLRDWSAKAKASGVSGSNTTCTMPSRSRKSMNITPPWSRRRCTQPLTVTVWSK